LRTLGAAGLPDVEDGRGCSVEREHAVDRATSDRSCSRTADRRRGDRLVDGPELVVRRRSIERLIVSPTMNDPVMIAVPSRDPTMTRSDSTGRRTV
jgi:hypothetical protein